MVIEHNLDVIKTADHILGPGGGVRGGEVVAQGTPEEVAAVKGSYTGQHLKPMLERQREAAGGSGVALLDYSLYCPQAFRKFGA